MDFAYNVKRLSKMLVQIIILLCCSFMELVAYVCMY